MKPTQGPNHLWTFPDAFAAHYCVRCKAGWTRAGRNGALTVCLLDREPVLKGMTDCDRFAVSAEFAARLRAARLSSTPEDRTRILAALRVQHSLAVQSNLDRWKTASADASTLRRLSQPMRPASSDAQVCVGAGGANGTVLCPFASCFRARPR
jgi:hypothetical protein